MSPTSSNKGPSAARGFTLIEVLVAMTILVTVVVASMAILFTMQRFSSYQQIQVEPRQTARRGLDYLSYYLRNAGSKTSYKNCGIVVWTANVNNIAGSQSVTSSVQVSYNNVTAAQSLANYADAGTDIISMVLYSSVADFNMVCTPDTAINGQGQKLSTTYWAGCPPGTNDVLNTSTFRADCQCAEADKAAALGYSPSIVFFNSNGRILLANLNATTDAPGGNPTPGIASNCGHGGLDIYFDSSLSLFNPPGVVPDMVTNAVAWYLAVPQFVSFRVKNSQLQQNPGLFNSAAPDAGFFPLLDNVEDMQIAYIFDDGTIWNTSVQQLPVPTAAEYNMAKFAVAPTGGVPLPEPSLGPQALTDEVHGLTHVIGVRASLIAHSTKQIQRYAATKGTFLYKPKVEDGTQGAIDYYFHYRLTATIMMRNMILGS